MYNEADMHSQNISRGTGEIVFCLVFNSLSSTKIQSLHIVLLGFQGGGGGGGGLQTSEPLTYRCVKSRYWVGGGRIIFSYYLFLY